MKTLLTTSVLVLLVGVWASPVLGVVIFEDHFAEYPIGNGNPGTPPVGADWTVEQEQYDWNIRIGDTGGDNCLIVQRASVQSQAPKAVANITSEGSTSIEGKTALISAEIHVPAGNAVYLQGRDGTTTLFNINLNAGDVTYYDGSTTVDTGLDFTTDQFESIEIDCDFTAHTFTISVEGNTTTGSTDVAFWNNGSTMTAFVLGAAKGTTGYIDDLIITPEPATIGLLLLGVGFLRRKW